MPLISSDGKLFLTFGSPEESPELVVTQANQLDLKKADLRFEANRKVLFGGNSQISAIGDISFLTGATSPTEQMKIFANGNIGIGTGATVPTSKLEVNGKIKATELLVDSIVTGTLAIQRDLNVSGSLILQNVTVNKFSSDGTLNGNSDLAIPTEKAVKTYVDDKVGAIPSSQWSSSGANLIYNVTNSNVGIGTSQPSAKLEVAGNFKLETGVVVNQFSNDTKLGESDQAVPTQKAVKAYVDGRVGAIPSSQWSNSGANLIYNVANSNVGIGTSQPGAKLEVAGNFKLQTGVAVNQFSNDTKLGDSDQAVPTQKAVKAYVDTKLTGGTGNSPWETVNNNIFYSKGNVGIGTNTPQAKLQVANGAMMLSDGKNGGIKFPENIGGGRDDTAWIQYYAREGQDCNLEIGISNDYDDHIILRTFGNVGIETQNPQANLHVYTEWRDNAKLRIQAAPKTSDGSSKFGSSSIEFWSDPQGSDNEWRPGFIQSTDQGGFTGGLGFYVNGTGKNNRQSSLEVMRITNGRVGIGTNSPGEALTVNGTVRLGAGGQQVFIGGNRTGPFLRLNDDLWFGDPQDGTIQITNSDGTKWGTLVGNFNPPSSIEYKKDVAILQKSELDKLLDEILTTDLVKFRYKGDDETSRLHLGVIAENSPSYLIGEDGKSVITIEYVAMLHAAIKALAKKLSILEETLAGTTAIEAAEKKL